MPTTTLTDATDFIVSRASEEALTQIIEAINQRRKALAAIRTASLVTGSDVRIANIKPHYLNGLTGTIVWIDGKAATVELDTESTDRLRFTPSNKRFVVPSDDSRYELPGVPLACCLTT